MIRMRKLLFQIQIFYGLMITITVQIIDGGSAGVDGGNNGKSNVHIDRNSDMNLQALRDADQMMKFSIEMNQQENEMLNNMRQALNEAIKNGTLSSKKSNFKESTVKIHERAIGTAEYDDHHDEDSGKLQKYIRLIKTSPPPIPLEYEQMEKKKSKYWKTRRNAMKKVVNHIDSVYGLFGLKSKRRQHRQINSDKSVVGGTGGGSYEQHTPISIAQLYGHRRQQRQRPLIME